MLAPPRLTAFAKKSRPSVTEREIRLAFRLMLHREPDEVGMASYMAAAARGLTIVRLVKALARSGEYRALRKAQRNGQRGLPRRPPPPATEALITPEEVMERLSLESLNQTAEEYYSRVEDPAWLMAKPFASLSDAPNLLQNLGMLFEGLHLGQMMTVLDFGGGTGWLTRQLAQLNCKPICCDVSATALSIGKRLFETQPPLGLTLFTPQFLHFDGRRLDLPDGSVDRVLCFDSFHHVPNPAEIIAEFGRVLCDGGIAGFSEPGRFHSRSPQSQYEMRYHHVLENDIDVNAIWEMAQSAGFTDITIRAVSNFEMMLSDYNELLDRTTAPDIQERVTQQTSEGVTNKSIFFLHKGPRRLDSRSVEALGGRITVSRTEVDVAAGETFSLTFTLENTGESLWRDRASEIFGLVRLGSHLAHADGRMINVDLARYDLPKPVPPGDKVTVRIDMVLPNAGAYLLSFDLVSEGVSWFENLGTQPAQVRVRVR